MEKKRREPQLAEIYGHFVQACGGTQPFALLLYEEFYQAKAGSFTRQRILDMILRMGRFVNERNGPTDDLGLMTEEDLVLHLGLMMEKIPKANNEAAQLQTQAAPAASDPSTGTADGGVFVGPGDGRSDPGGSP